MAVIDEKFFEIISSPEAWHINEDYSPPTANALRPTNSALKVRDLFEQVTDRYRALPTFEHRLPFFADIQIPLIDGYIQRISSATDAFETLSFGLMRAVPGNLAGMEASSARLTHGLNGLQRLIRALVSASWTETVLKEWSEDLVSRTPSPRHFRVASDRLTLRKTASSSWTCGKTCARKQLQTQISDRSARVSWKIGRAHV